MSNFTAEEITGCLVSELEFEGKIFIAHPDLVKINVNCGNSAVANHWAKHTQLTEQQVQDILKYQALGAEIIISIPNYSNAGYMPTGFSHGCIRPKDICGHSVTNNLTQMPNQKVTTPFLNSPNFNN